MRPPRPIVLINNSWVNCSHIQASITTEPPMTMQELVMRQATGQLKGVKVTGDLRLIRTSDGAMLMVYPIQMQISQRPSGRALFNLHTVKPVVVITKEELFGELLSRALDAQGI